MATKTATQQTSKEDKQEACNMVFLAGKVYYISVGPKSAMVVLDTGERGRVAFKCFDSQLLKQLDHFSKDDFIRIYGKLGQEKNQETGKYDRLMVVLTTIKSPIPVKRSKAQDNGDDNLPF